MREEVDFESKQKMAAVVLKLVLVSLPFAAGIIYFSSRGSASRPATSAVPRPEASAAQEPGPAKSDRAEPAAELPGASAAATPPAARAGAVVVTPTPPEERAAADASAPMRLDVVPTADCWIKLTVDGSVAVSRVIPAGERESRAFAESAVLIVGDAGACAIAINGQAAKPLGREKQVREIRVTRDNFRTFLP